MTKIQKYTFIGIGALAVIALVAVIAKPYHPKPIPLYEESVELFPAEALEIEQKLYDKSTEFNKKQDEQDQYYIQIAQLEEEKEDLKVTAASYDVILCREFGLIYNRPKRGSITQNAQSGSLVRADGNCPLK